jgi:hypothetical protein
MGGNSWNSNLAVGGLGGAAFPAAPARVVLGGGGGAGSRNNSSAFASSGGTGGGIVMIRTGTLTGAGTINANGGVGVTPDNDGGGGGGAGGSIVVSASAGTVNGLTATANGGNGTDAWPADAGGLPDRHGPGGGGSGGVIITSNALPPAQASVQGGAHGITTTLDDAYGSTSGNPGVVLTTTLAAIPGSSSGAECVSVVAVSKTTSTANVTNSDGNDRHLLHNAGQQRGHRACDQRQRFRRSASRVHVCEHRRHRAQWRSNANGGGQSCCR